MVKKIAGSLLFGGCIGLILVLLAIAFRIMKGKKSFGIGSALLSAFFTLSIGLGIFVGINDKNENKVKEKVVSNIVGKETTSATEANKVEENKKQDTASSEKKKDDTNKTQASAPISTREPSKTKPTDASDVSKPTDSKEPIQILKCYVDYRDYQYSVHYELKNISTKTIDAYTTTTLMFDGFGEPIIYYKTRANNINHIFQSYNLNVGQVDTMVTGDVLDTTKKVKGIIMKVHFTDGTVWENPKWNEFMSIESKSYKQ